MIFKNKKNQTNTRTRRVNLQDIPTKAYNYRSTRVNTDYGIRKPVSPDNETRSIIKPKRSWLYHIPSVIIAVIIGFSLIYVFTLDDNDPKVLVINDVKPNFLQPLSVYQSAASKILSQSLLNRSKLTINTDEVAAKLVKEYPEIVNASVVVPIVDHTPIVEIQPAVSAVILSNSTGDFVIDEQGNDVSQIQSSLVSQFASLPLVTDQSGLIVKSGEPVLSTTAIQFLDVVTDQFRVKGIKVQSMTLAPIPYQLNVQLAGDSYYIKFNLQGNARLEVGTYFATSAYLSSQNITPGQYIDVRVSGKAYYQ
jgi:hypothetical protein